MPATRLRNHDWLKSLQQVNERNGSLDVTVASSGKAATSEGGAPDEADRQLLWRVRLLDLTDTDFTIEQPTTLGKPVELQNGIELVVILSIGQNRWMFRTKKLATRSLSTGGGRYGHRPTTGIRLALPEVVERCQRRANYRVSTESVNLPSVEIWPLLDPKTVVLAERANQLASAGEAKEEAPIEIQLPDVGPKFSATLLNLGGGGVGLGVCSDQAQSLLRNKLFWMRIHLPNVLEAPICATAKVVHTHMTAAQDYYAGLAFDFTFNPVHQDHVVSQINRYVAHAQREQVRLRKSA